ncbi:MAG: hypothetical protein ACM335_13170 [Deltaproteobacteria bacterium]
MSMFNRVLLALGAYSGEVAMLFRGKSPPYSGIMRHPLVGA